MLCRRILRFRVGGCLFFLLALMATLVVPARAADLAEIKQRGVLRHLGIPYANFISGSGDGLDADIVRLFAAHVGVEYRYVSTTWEEWTQDLTGNKVAVEGDDIRIVGSGEVKGDLIACGLTILPWREKVVDFSRPTFPTQVWLLTRSDSTVHPIAPSQDILQDVAAVKALLKEGRIKQILGKKATCLDPDLYQLPQTGVACKLADKLNLNELAPALIKGEAESILLDVPDALIAMEKWMGQLKIIGPVSEPQYMSVGFPKDARQLREAFEAFMAQCKRDGTYLQLVRKYYPSAQAYFPDFFKDVSSN